MSDNSIISYTSKTYDTILKDMLSSIPLLTNKWVNYAEDDPGVVLLKLVASLADMMCYNMDCQVLETFPQQATQRKNAQNGYSLINYKMKWYRSSTTILKIDYEAEPEDLPTVTIPNYTPVYTVSGTPFVIVDTAYRRTIGATETEESRSEITAVQGTVGTISGITLQKVGLDGRIYFNHIKVDENHIAISTISNSTQEIIPEYAWSQVANLVTTFDTGRYFEFKVDDYGNPYIQLCDNFADYMNDVTLHVTFIKTDGVDGNIGANTLTTFGNVIRDKNGHDVTGKLSILSNTSTLNGKGPESLAEAAYNAVKSVGTLNTAVTLQDYNTLGNNVTGIRKIRTLDINIDDDAVIHYPTFSDFPRLNEEGIPVVTVGGVDVPQPISYRALYVDDSTLLTYRLYKSTPDDAELTYERVDLLLQVVTTDFTNPTSLMEHELDNVFSQKKVFTLVQSYTMGKTNIIPYDVIVYANEPYSISLQELLTNDVSKALAVYYNDYKREFGEFIKYTDITTAIEKSNKVISYVDVITPLGNIQCDQDKFPRLGNINVVLSDSPQLTLVRMILSDRKKAVEVAVDGSYETSSLDNRDVLNSTLYSHIYSNNTSYIEDDVISDTVCYCTIPVISASQTHEPLVLFNEITLFVNDSNQILCQDGTVLGILPAEYDGSSNELTLSVDWYCSRSDIISFEEYEGNYIGVIQNTRFTEDVTIELSPSIRLGTTKLSTGWKIYCTKKGLFE